MNILAIDTSSTTFSVCLSKAGSLIKDERLNENKPDSLLLPSIDSILKKADIELSDLSYIGLAGGPGSFTSLRVVFSTVKSLCFALNIPLITVSSLDVFKRRLEKIDADVKLALIDARNHSFYAHIIERNKEVLFTDISFEKTTEIIENSKSVAILGDAMLTQKAFLSSPKIVKVDETLHISGSEDLISLCEEKRLREGFDNLLSASPTYIRISEAEKKLLKKEGENA